MMKIGKGFFIPLYGNDSSIVNIDDFFMDIYPVTNREFKAFVSENNEWARSNVKKLFADGNYLIHWASNDDYGTALSGEAPVTNISWFAAKSYCNSQGKRLPTIDEWEYVAMADDTKPDARKDKAYNQKILDWYESSRTFGKEVGSTFKNYWGIYDMHGLVWEWSQDFNSVLISGESRKDVDSDKNLFCGSATVGANDLMNYAAFMRFAFRGSLKANYAIKNLGFRCAQSIPKVEN